MLSKILVSSCLLGNGVRYDGTSRRLHHPALMRWLAEDRIISICPEVAAGFSIPRPPAEIGKGLDGNAFWTGKARVIELGGADVSARYRTAGELALALAVSHGCKYALLTDGSPSCGATYIFDGSFQGNRHKGKGTTATLLEMNGIRVFAESQIDDLAILAC